MNLDNVRDEVQVDPIGTVRVSLREHSIVVYVKCDEGWHAVYVHPDTGYCVSRDGVAELIAGLGDVVWVPNPVGPQHE